MILDDFGTFLSWESLVSHPNFQDIHASCTSRAGVCDGMEQYVGVGQAGWANN